MKRKKQGTVPQRDVFG